MKPPPMGGRATKTQLGPEEKQSSKNLESYVETWRCSANLLAWNGCKYPVSPEHNQHIVPIRLLKVVLVYLG